LKSRRSVQKAIHPRRRAHRSIRHQMKVNQSHLLAFEMMNDRLEQPVVAVTTGDDEMTAPCAVGETGGEPFCEASVRGAGVEEEPLDGPVIPRRERGHDTIRLPPSAEAALQAARTSSISAFDIQSVSNSSPSAK